MTGTDRTVTFIDLAGFTVATHGDETAADLADRLTYLTRSERSRTPDSP